MADRDLFGLAATTKLGGHLNHPMLVPFSIALSIAAIICGLVYLLNRDPFWAAVSVWPLGAAIVTPAAAAVAGLTSFFGSARVCAISNAWKSLIGNVVVPAGASSWLFDRRGADAAVWSGAFALSLMVVPLLLCARWTGGEIVYHNQSDIHSGDEQDAGGLFVTGRP